MPASSLVDAANKSYTDLYALWVATTLKAKLTSFYAAAQVIFPDQTAAAVAPCNNWLSLIASLYTTMAATVAYQDMNTSANYVYRLCWVANALETQGLVTSAQATALLAAYNANFE